MCLSILKVYCDIRGNRKYTNVSRRHGELQQEMEPRWILTRPELASERALTIVEMAFMCVCVCVFFQILHPTCRHNPTCCCVAPYQIHPKNGWRAGEALEMFLCVNIKIQKNGCKEIFVILILLALINSRRDIKAEDPDGGPAQLSTSTHSSHSSESPRVTPSQAQNLSCLFSPVTSVERKSKD